MDRFNSWLSRMKSKASTRVGASLLGACLGILVFMMGPIISTIFLKLVMIVLIIYVFGLCLMFGMASLVLYAFAISIRKSFK
jgi:hypothetical protein